MLIRAGLAVGAAALLLAGCAPAPDPEGSNGASDFCARMVTNSGGLEDRSFNQASWEGLQRAADEFGIDVDALVSTGETDLEPNVTQAVDSGCQFVLTVGYELVPATDAAAIANPDVDFAIVDDVVDQPNVKPIVFNTAEAAYLAGYLAAGVSQTGKVATFGGGNQPPVTLFMDGFVDGVAAYNAAHGTAVQALGWNKDTQDGVFTGDFEDINKGLITTQNFIAQGADVILPVAGQVGEGAAQAALASGTTLVIWVDADGYDVLSADYRPVLLTSVLKNTGDAVVESVQASMDGTFTNEPFVGTLENGGVDIAPDQLRQDIIDGKITVTSPSTPG
jgi:basic membrane protein A